MYRKNKLAKWLVKTKEAASFYAKMSEEWRRNKMDEYNEKTIHELCEDYVKQYGIWSMTNKDYTSIRKKLAEKWGIAVNNNENILNEIERKKEQKKKETEQQILAENTNEELQRKVKKISCMLISSAVLFFLTIAINIINLFRPLALSTFFRAGVWTTFFLLAVVLSGITYILVEKVLSEQYIPLWKHRAKRVKVKCSKVAAVAVGTISLLIGFFYIAIQWGLWGNNTPIEGSFLEKWSEFGFCFLTGMLGGVVIYFVCYKREISIDKVRAFFIKDSEEEQIQNMIDQALQRIETDYENDRLKLENAGGVAVDKLHEKLKKIVEQMTGKLTAEQMNAMLSDKLYLAEWDKLEEEYENQDAKGNPYEVTGVEWKKGPVVFLYTWENRGTESEVLNRLLSAVCLSCNLFNVLSLCESFYIDYQSDCRIGHKIFDGLKVTNRKEDEKEFRNELTKHKKEILAKLQEQQASYIDQYNKEQLKEYRHYLLNKIIHFIIPDTSVGSNISWETNWWDILTDCITYGIFPIFYVEKCVWEGMDTSFIKEFHNKFVLEGYSVYEVNLVDGRLNVTEIGK